ncbi:flavocytochrome c [Anoxynatronum buryatiense]|uniref:Flavocytochrome c n=1 Tax=Anoxynatronum buryatiense TaxID=489973 RepID=A0AA45WXP7_9CLOT|nr:flavocytochrome c [Anoxynatronum buryatiense]SMP63654.1 flavocytochrome c [Anoxynatronum buryatiense]
MSQSLDRRKFLKQATIAGAALAGVSLLPGCVSQLAEDTQSDKDIVWNEETDVLVVGSGFAGFAAAIEAKETGADVMLIEKMPLIGGNSMINGGDFSCAGTAMQAANGIEDSAEKMAEDMMRSGSFLNHPEKVKVLTEKSNEALEWTMDHLGVEYIRIAFHGGHSVPRTHTTSNGTGSDIILAMAAKLESLGVSSINGRKLTGLIQSDEKRIVGIKMRDGYRFGDEDSGTELFIKANKAVVLASGGFSGDARMRILQDPRITEEFETTNHVGATGEALREALKVNAMDVHMDWIQLGPWTSPDEKGFGYVPQFCERLVGYGLMVNPQDAKRFIAETGNRKVRADAIIAIGEPVLIIGDSYAVERQVLPHILEKGLENGAVKKFDTIDELVQEYNMDSAAFSETLDRWNSMVIQGKDDDFNCAILEGAQPTEAGPFYAARLWPRVHHTMGGLVTNEKTQVINQDFEPIEGLYAAGEITGGVHGAVRLGGVAIADCIVFGRIAGQEASKA